MASKADLRRLMNKQKTGKKVDHPMARYNASGTLSCVLCSVNVKNDLVWPAHLQCRRHKEAVAEIKNNKNKPQPPPAARTTSNTFKQPSKDLKRHSQTHQTEPDIKKTKSVSSLPPDFFDQSSKKSSHQKTDTPSQQPKDIPTNNQLPADFFDRKTKPTPETPADEKISNSAATTSPEGEKTDAITSKESLPEGFFDDPKKDAKARKVEYVDPKEEEWEKFQKMISEENKVADTLIEEEEEESEMTKDISELNKFKSCLSRVDHLKLLKEQMREKLANSKSIKDINMTASTSLEENKTEPNDESMNVDDNDDDDDDELDNLLNWRSKKA